MTICGRCGDKVTGGISSDAQDVLRFMVTYGLCPKDLVILTDPVIQEDLAGMSDGARLMIYEIADILRSGNLNESPGPFVKKPIMPEKRRARPLKKPIAAKPVAKKTTAKRKH